MRWGEEMRVGEREEGGGGGVERDRQRQTATARDSQRRGNRVREQEGQEIVRVSWKVDARNARNRRLLFTVWKAVAGDRSFMGPKSRTLWPSRDKATQVQRG